MGADFPTRQAWTSDKARYDNFAGRDGAARSGLKMGGRGRQRAPLLLIFGGNCTVVVASPQDARS